MSLEDQFTPADREWQGIMNQWGRFDNTGAPGALNGLKGNLFLNNDDVLSTKGRLEVLTVVSTPNPEIAQEVALSDRNKLPGVLTDATYIQSHTGLVLISQELRFNKTTIHDWDTGENLEAYDVVRVEMTQGRPSATVSYYEKVITDLHEQLKGYELIVDDARLQRGSYAVPSAISRLFAAHAPRPLATS